MGNKQEKNAKKEIEEAESSEDERGKWANPMEFVLSCLGYAVGLGNVWRFPYLCYTNGGGAFLIPYAIMLTFVGLPVFFIELSVGQYCGGGPLTVFDASPLFRGVGLGMVIISFIGSIYYNMIIGWSLYYMFMSWTKTLPWATCSHGYNTEKCYSRKEEIEYCTEKDSAAIWYNNTCYNSTYLSDWDVTYPCNDSNPNTTICVSNTVKESLKNLTATRVSASEEYFNYGLLDRLDTMDEAGEMKWHLVLIFLLAWVLCYFCVIKGIKSSGKVVYFTATFPYVIIFILLIRGALLEGSLEGIKFYIIPKWEQLKTPKVWVDAAGQIFFSLSVGMGGLMTFASYNKFHNNVYRDTMIVAIGNCLTSFVAGFAIFSILGHLAFILDREVKDVAKSGSGLAFVVYPEVVLWLEPPQLWSTLFFFMLLTLGLDSQFAGLENIMTAIVDLNPKLRKHKHWVALALCTVMFILGLTQCTQTGIYWLELMSYYSSGWSLVLIGLCEACVFAWVYTAKRLMKDIEEMIGSKLYMHWWVCWTIITPLLLIAILIFNIYDTTPLNYGDYVLPDWAQTLGWLMAVVSVVVIPIFMIYEIAKSYKDPEYKSLSFRERLRKLTKPNENWRPSFEKEAEQKLIKSSTRGAGSPSGYPATENHGFEEIDEKGNDLTKSRLPNSRGNANPGYDDQYQETEDNCVTRL